MKRLLLVAPERKLIGFDESHLHAVVKSAVAPADLATIAALTPPEYRVDIWDEAIRGQISSTTRFPHQYDLVGVGGYTSDLERALDIGRVFRSRGVPVVVGGVGVTSEPERYRDVFDVLFIGEAEYTWPQFLRDVAHGNHLPEYRQVSRVDLADSPPPNWSALARDVDKYAWTVVQTTRGCPFDCEFCDVITLFGRQPRHKSIEQVLGEIRALERLGATAVLLADDNFYGHVSFYKALLREMIVLNNSFRRPLRFWTQITLNVSKDDEMLDLLTRANVSSILIGIESPNIESLIETRKPQNYKLDIVGALKKIQSYGLRIEASLIVGFDHDDVTIFDQQFDFIQEAALAPVSIWTLYAMPGTRLWTRLHKEQRVLEEPRLKKLVGLNARVITNVVPKRMTLDDLYSGYRDLLERVHDWANFEARLSDVIDRIQQFPEPMLRVRTLTLRQAVRLLYTILFTRAGLEGALRLRADAPAHAIKQRLKARVTGNSPRARFARTYIDNAVLEQHHVVRYVLPRVLEGLDAERARLREHGLPSREKRVFAIPEPLRAAFKIVFASAHQRVHDGLIDKSRAEVALVEVFADFVARWGETFTTFEDHHRVSLEEFCDRVIAAENTLISQRGRVPAGADEPPPQGVRLRALAQDVLRCVEEQCRHRHPDAVEAPAAALA